MRGVPINEFLKGNNSSEIAYIIVYSDKAGHIEIGQAEMQM